jgi:excisionase family DNA binding protein
MNGDVQQPQQIQPLVWKPEEAAQALTVSVPTLWRLVKRQGLPVIRMGRVVRFDPADVQAWLAKQKTGGTPTGEISAPVRVGAS